jgi:hypothetical protein
MADPLFTLHLRHFYGTGHRPEICVICQMGKCCICEKDIATTCVSCGTKKFTQDHTRIEVKWSNGSVMPIGVCRSCAEKHAANMSDEIKKGITEAHINFWEGAGGHPDRSIVIV